ncbi:MAG: putative Membrane protein [Acidobacteriaceae bacterium]|jgi:protein-disulfide isomerase|nr:putative Membrane protein [Acidobacteriaceae bacterium]
MASTLKVPVSSSDHIQGDEHAPVTLVEYGDYECPHCGVAYYIVKTVQNHYGNQLRFVFRNFPLTEIHPYAEPAAEAAELAAVYDQFWEMHDGIYENQDRLGIPLLFELGGELGLPPNRLRDAIANHEFSDKIQGDFLGGVRSGVNGTPTFFVNNIRHDGSYEFEDLVADIDAHLSQAKAVSK